MRTTNPKSTFRGAIAACALIGMLSVPVRADDPPKAPENFTESFDKGGFLFDDGNGVIHIRQSGSTAETDYAPGIKSSGNFYARLMVQPGANVNSDGNPSCAPGVQSCFGPFTEWGLPWGSFDGNFGTGVPIHEDGAVTQVDIYLDTNFAATHHDYRFDWDSDLLDSKNQFLQDYIFNAGTSNPAQPVACGPANQAYFVIAASTNSQRGSAFPQDPNKMPQCITVSGWYTFRHTFHADHSGKLEVDMDILNSKDKVVASWVIHPTCMGTQVSEGLCTVGQPLPFAAVGANFLGWFTDQEINNLAIDNLQRRNGGGHD